MFGTRHVEWLNQNSGRSYPFREDSGLVPSDSTGAMPDEYRVPNGLVLDFIVAVPYGTPAASGVYMSSLTMMSGSATVVVSDMDGNVVASVSSPESPSSHNPVSFRGSGRYELAVGTIVFGDVASMAGSYPDGTYSFSPRASAFEARCVRPSTEGVSSINTVSQSGSYLTRRLVGDVSLVAGRNITLRYDASMNAIWIDAANDTGYSEECDCGNSGDTEIRTINGVSAKNVKIQGGDCIKVETSNGVIRLTDTCSKPCCGCEELAFLTGKSNQIATALMKLEAFANSLSSRMSELASVMETNRLSVAAATSSAGRA